MPPTNPRAVDQTDSASPEEGLRSQARAGAVWTSLVTLGSRLQQTVLQVVLAWLLSPEDFGLIALAYTVMAYAWFLKHAGLGAVLIQRQKRFHLWVSPATGLIAVTGTLATLLALLSAAPAAAAYGQPRLTGIIAVLAISVLPDALRAVAQAKLRRDLRFQADAVLQLVALALIFVLTLVLAATGAGVYSFVIPRVVVSVVMLAVEWYVAHPGVRLGRVFGHWRFLLTSSAWVTAAGLCVQVMNQGDYTVLGLYATKEEIGWYFFAFMLSTQTMMLVTINLGGVLIPVLARMQDRPAVQAERFLETCGLIALLSVPACLGLALVADPLIRVLFDPRYYGAIPLLQLLSVGMAFRTVGHNGSFILQANGRWRKYFLLSITNAAAFVICCLIGAATGGLLGLTLAVTLFYASFGFTQLRVALAGRIEAPWQRILELYGLPLVICVPWYAALWLAHDAVAPPPVLGLPTLILLGGAGPLLLLRWRHRSRLDHLLDQLPLRRLKRRGKRADPEG